jgi:hypothetical protein
MTAAQRTFAGVNLVSKFKLVMFLLSMYFVGIGSSQAKDGVAAIHIEQTIAALKRMTDADSLAAAGLLSVGKHSDQSLPLIERAIAAAPIRADLIWLQAEVCAKVGSCDPVAIQSRLREVDPFNAAGWVGALVRANSSNDEEAKDAALVAIGHSDRFDIYWTTLVSRLSEAVIQVHKMSPKEAVVTVVGYQAAEPIPDYDAAARACKGDRLQRAAVNEACRGVARAFQQGDTYLTEMIGVAIAKRVWPEDSPEWKAAAEARRVYDYRSKLWLKLDVADNAHTEKYLVLCSKYRREQDLWLAQITAAGWNPNPPVD